MIAAAPFVAMAQPAKMPQGLRITVTSAEVRNAGEFDAAFAVIGAARPQALMITIPPSVLLRADRVIE